MSITYNSGLAGALEAALKALDELQLPLKKHCGVLKIIFNISDEIIKEKTKKAVSQSLLKGANKMNDYITSETRVKSFKHKRFSWKCYFGLHNYERKNHDDYNYKICRRCKKTIIVYFPYTGKEK